MRLAQTAGPKGRPVAVAGDTAVPVGDPERGIRSLDDLVQAGPEAWEAARARAAEGRDAEPAPSPPAAPIARPSKIVCVGLNYRDHAKEAELDLPAEPLLFAKFPSTIVGPGVPIAWPEGLTEKVDWEAELAVVVGRGLRDADVEECGQAVFGYTVANDVSARDLQFGDGQWTRGKSLDGFCPLGPEIVTADEVPDPHALAIRTRVNDELVQDSNTSEMVFGVDQILSFCSHAFTLFPGDLVLTGTPAGVGGFQKPPRFLGDGDHVEVEVEGVGVLPSPIAGGVSSAHLQEVSS